MNTGIRGSTACNTSTGRAASKNGRTSRQNNGSGQSVQAGTTSSAPSESLLIAGTTGHTTDSSPKNLQDRDTQLPPEARKASDADSTARNGEQSKKAPPQTPINVPQTRKGSTRRKGKPERSGKRSAASAQKPPITNPADQPKGKTKAMTGPESHAAPQVQQTGTGAVEKSLSGLTSGQAGASSEETAVKQLFTKDEMVAFAKAKASEEQSKAVIELSQSLGKSAHQIAELTREIHQRGEEITCLKINQQLDQTRVVFLESLKTQLEGEVSALQENVQQLRPEQEKLQALERTVSDFVCTTNQTIAVLESAIKDSREREEIVELQEQVRTLDVTLSKMKRDIDDNQKRTSELAEILKNRQDKRVTMQLDKASQIDESMITDAGTADQSCGSSERKQQRIEKVSISTVSEDNISTRADLSVSEPSMTPSITPASASTSVSKESTPKHNRKLKDIDAIYDYAEACDIPVSFVYSGYKASVLRPGFESLKVLTGQDAQSRIKSQLKIISKQLDDKCSQGTEFYCTRSWDEIWKNACDFEIFLSKKANRKWALMEPAKGEKTLQQFSSTMGDKIQTTPVDWLRSICKALQTNPKDKAARLAGIWADFSLQVSMTDDERRKYKGSDNAFNWRELGATSRGTDEPDASGDAELAPPQAKKKKTIT